MRPTIYQNGNVKNQRKGSLVDDVQFLSGIFLGYADAPQQKN